MTREEAIKFLKLDKEDRGKCFISDAIDMAIKALEQESNKSEIPTSSIEIKVGDEVIVEGVNGIVVREPYHIGSDNELFVLVWYGQRMSSNSLKNVAPTGRHFPQITEVLEQLRRSYCGGIEE